MPVRRSPSPAPATPPPHASSGCPDLPRPADGVRPLPTGTAAAILLGVLLLGGPEPARAQTARGFFRDARQPRPGVVWFEVAPTFESWSSQFSAGPPGDSAAAGTEVPLSADFDGPVLRRVFGADDLLLAPLRSDGQALGFGDLSASEVSVGRLRFSELHRNRRSVPLDLEVGILDRLSATVRAPFVKTEVEAFFEFDPDGATFAPATFALEDGSTFLSELRSAREQLRARLESGEIDPARRERARALLESSGAFLGALSRRFETGALIPLAGSRPGRAMLDRSGTLRGEFGAFGLQVPAMDLAGASAEAALQQFFTGGAMAGDSLVGRERGWTLGELEVGARFRVLDTFRSHGRSRPRGARRRRPGSDTLGRDAPGRDTAAGPESGSGSRSGGLQLRTTVGATVRLPLGPADEAPFLTPASHLDMPVGDGQPDVEAAVYQDLRLGRLLLRGNARFGLQMSDQVRLRVRAPDRPFAPAAAAVAVRRDLGDYVRVRVAPQFVLNRALRVGAEYTYWEKGRDDFGIVESGGEGPRPGSAAPLAARSRQQRQRLGIGIFYRAADEETDPSDRPVEAGFVFQVAASGSGGQTPASQLTTFRVRVPIGLF